MLKNKVSIITPSYNSSRYISQTIESVLVQTYENWEMIIVDDVSPDHSNEIIEEYAKKDNRIKLIKLEKNSGAANARNEGIQQAVGKYIAFLDSDDIWLPEKLTKQIEFMHKNEVVLCYSSYFIMDENSKQIGQFNISKTKVSYKELLKTCIIGNLTAMYDAEQLGKFYMEDIGHEDYTLWLKILKKIDNAYGIEKPLAKYRISKKSISSNKIKAATWQWKIYREVEKLSLFESIYYFVQYVYYGVRKYKKTGLEVNYQLKML